MKIYFAHSVTDYNTEYENICLTNIRKLYPDAEIINPKDIPVERKDDKPNSYIKYISQMRRYYFPVISKCDLVIVAFTNETGKFSDGVKREIEYTQKKNIKIKYLDVVINNVIQISK